MARTKRAIVGMKKRRKLLKDTKGYRFGRSKKEREAREAYLHAGRNAFRDRKKKKRDMRRLWNIKINAGAREHELSYSTLIAALKKKNIGINRKALAEIAEKEPEAFARIIKAAR